MKYDMKDMTNTRTRSVAGLLLIDAALVVAACMVPAVSHVVALPLYMLNPMLALLLAGMLVGKDWRNGLLLALLMPAVSCLVTGMPAPAKMLCMAAELATVAVLFGVLSRRWKVLPAVLVSVLVAKVVYYALKALIISPAALVGTNMWLQIAVVLLWGGLFAMFHSRKKQ